MPYTFQVPTAPLVTLALRLMPPTVKFGSPALRVPGTGEAHYHIPVTVHPMLFKRVGPGEVANCEAYLDLYEGENRTRTIRMCWGDLQQTTSNDVELLRHKHVSLIPVVWRSELEKGCIGFVTDAQFLNKKQRAVPIKDRMRFRLRIKSGSFERASSQFYLIRCPPIGSSNGQFTVEEEYEGHGHLGAQEVLLAAPGAVSDTEASPPEDFAKVTFETNRPSPKHPFVLTATIRINRESRDVAVIAKSARAVFYMSGNPSWKQTQSSRVLERNVLYPNETIPIEMFHRPAEGADVLRVFGKDEELYHGVPTLYRFELIVSALGEKQVSKIEHYQFHPSDSPRVSLPLVLSTLPHVIEEDE